MKLEDIFASTPEDHRRRGEADKYGFAVQPALGVQVLENAFMETNKTASEPLVCADFEIAGRAGGVLRMRSMNVL